MNVYTTHTYQDWEQTPEHKRPETLKKIVAVYKASTDFRVALVAMKYFLAENEAVSRKKLLRSRKFTVSQKETTPSGNEITREKTGLRNVEIEGNRAYSRFFYRIVTQENQHLLSNGVTIGDVGDIPGDVIKKRLGPGFDTTLQQIGEKALIHGACWGYWNYDHLETVEAAKDHLSGFVALVDEETSAPRVGVQFWQIAANRPLYVRLFEEDGVTVYRADKNGNLFVHRPKRPYIVRTSTDAAGTQVIGTANYSALPLIPLYANPEKRTEFDNSIKSKVDMYDRILSDFGDNLDRANDVYWVLNNFGGSTADICEMIEQIEKIRAVVNISDGVGGGSTAQPHTIEVPYMARQTALELLEKAIYEDAMAMHLKEITGGSLTNVAIKAATTNLDLKCDRYEWQVYTFVQSLLRLVGIETEVISFVRKALVNQSETVADIATMREDIDQETALRLNPYIMPDEIEDILERTAAERYTGSARYPPTDTEEVTDDEQDDESSGDDRAEDA